MAINRTFGEELIDRDANIVAPNVFVGLGGQGCDMVAQLAALAKEKGYNNDKLAFIALDTDVNELRRIRAKANNVVTVQTSSRMTIGEYLMFDENARDKWFPINDILLDKTPSEGAGQVRAISNLVAHNAIREGEFSKIDDAIDELFELNDDNFAQSIHVTIIGTVAGGTGSGLILPVSLYIRNYLEKVRQQKSSVFRGFFLLPDVMDSVIHTTEERHNLYANAYATLREIDAFMRRPYDAQIQKRYPNLKVILPKTGTEGYEEFNEKPFDFCFLFNKTNFKETNIKDKDDLLEHAVECIFNMSISPLASRINSEEDNTIRQKVKTENRKSYAGIGSSKLVYPFEDVVDYITLDWVKESISKDWFSIDKEVEKQRLQLRGAVDSFDEDREYVNAVKNQTSKAFVGSIFNQTQIETSPNTFIDKAQCYIRDVENYIKKELDKVDAEDSFLKKRCSDKAVEVKGEFSPIDVKDKNDTLKSRHTMAMSIVNIFDELASSSVASANKNAVYLAQSLLNIEPHDVGTGNISKIPVLEFALSGNSSLTSNNNNFFMHPNAARYFLNQVSTILADKIEDYEKKCEIEEKQLEIAKARLDFLKISNPQISNERTLKERKAAPANEDIEIADIVLRWSSTPEIAKSLEEKKASSNENQASNEEKKVSNSENKVAKKENQSGNLTTYCVHIASRIIFSELKKYVDSLIEGYKQIFLTLRDDINGIDEKIELLQDKYCDNSDTTNTSKSRKAIKYVCADKDCLAQFAIACKNPINVNDLPAEFTYQFFAKARRYANKKISGALEEEYGIYPGCPEERVTKAHYAMFGDVFEEIVMVCWRNFVIREYVKKDNKLDMNILKAAYKEAGFKGHNDRNDQRDYVEDLIKRACNLSVEFIDRPRGKMPHELTSALLSVDLLEQCAGDDIDHLKDSLDRYQSVFSQKASKYEIRYLTAAYMIGCNDIVKMSPPIDNAKTNDVAKRKVVGKYFEVYHERVANIDPLDEYNTEITPHIQKDWQFINALPEIDDDYQVECETKIAKAFVYALISGIIDYRKMDDSGFNFTYELISKNLVSPPLTVSNGTYCDQLYETLDALSMQSKYVDNILQAFRHDLREEKDCKIKFEDSRFVKRAGNFVLNEYANEASFSIFDLPLLYKESAGAEYKVEWGKAIIRAIVEMIGEVAATLSKSREVEKNRIDFILKMYNAFEASLETIEKLGSQKTEFDDNGIKTRAHIGLQDISKDTVTLHIYDVISDLLQSNDDKHHYSLQHKDVIEEIRTKRRNLAQ